MHGDSPRRQPDEAREQDHAPAEHPDDAGENELRVVDAEGPGRADDGQLEGDEQRAAGHEIARERRVVSPSWRPCRNALVPARKTKAGAQKCVTQRVKNTPGEGPPAGTPEYTRT